MEVIAYSKPIEMICWKCFLDKIDGAIGSKSSDDNRFLNFLTDGWFDIDLDRFIDQWCICEECGNKFNISKNMKKIMRILEVYELL